MMTLIARIVHLSERYSHDIHLFISQETLELGLTMVDGQAHSAQIAVNAFCILQSLVCLNNTNFIFQTHENVHQFNGMCYMNCGASCLYSIFHEMR